MTEPQQFVPVSEQARKLAKWLDFQFGGPQVGNQVRAIADHIEKLEAKDEESKQAYRDIITATAPLMWAVDGRWPSAVRQVEEIARRAFPPPSAPCEDCGLVDSHAITCDVDRQG